MASIFQVVARLAQQKPQEPAAVDGAAVLTYAELHDAAMCLARAVYAEAAATLQQGVPTIGTCMRRGNEFYVAFLGASYCHFPIAAMSTDHPDQAAQAARNNQILNELRPAIVVCDAWVQEAALEQVRHVFFEDLLNRGRSLDRMTWRPAPPNPAATLCFQHTGGTTGASRCCAATHAMALWEIEKYPEVVRLEKGSRVLQQHSVYWMASMAGEIDIALSFGSALVFCEARTSEEIARAIQQHQISCAGLVPSILAELDPRSLPSLKVVFTWGEALQTRTAVQWATKVHLIDLLIASEYWLTLFADWSEWSQSASRVGTRPAFKSVSGAQVQLRPDEAFTDPSVNQGELLVAGPQVTSGYVGSEPYRNFLSGWYRTSDCLEEVSGGYKFAGRADDMVKVGGVWVDTRQLCEELREVEGVKAACMYSKAAFVSLDTLGAATLPTLRRKLPADHALFVVPELPRNQMTGKVDRRQLDVMTGRGVRAGLGVDPRERQDQLAKLRGLSKWYGLLLMLLFWPACDLLAGPREQDFLAVFFLDLATVLIRAWLLAYLFLSFMYRKEQIVEYCMYFPFDVVGCFTFVAGVAPLWLLTPLSMHGMWHAYRRGRWHSWPAAALLSYPKWAEDRCTWWASARWSDIPAWYKKRLIMKLPLQLKKFLGHARKCASCKNFRDRGRVDPSVDPHWYCDACWRHYHSHWQCGGCRTWVTRGRKEGTKWFCFSCARKGAEAAKQAPAAAPAPSALAAPLLPTPSAPAEEPERGDVPAVKRQRVEDRWVQNYAAASSASEVARSLSRSRSGPAGSSPSPARPSSVPADSRQSGRSTGPRLDNSRSPRRPAPARPESAGDSQLQLEPQFRYAFHHAASVVEPLPAAVEKSHLWRLVEEVTDFRFGSPSERIALDSMRWQRLTSRLRRQEGRNLPWDAQRRCGTLGELLREIEGLPVVQGSALQPREMDEVPGWFMMWSSKCLWKIHIQRPVADAALRYALEELMWRHSSLRVSAADKAELFKHFQIVLSVVQLWWMWLMDREGCVARLGRRVLSVLAHYFDQAWPRLGFGPAKVEDVLTILPLCASVEEAQELLTNPKVNWTPPFQAIFAPYGPPGRDQRIGGVLLLRISHMISDGFSIVPLMSDLSTLLYNAEKQLQGEVPRPLPPVDSALKVLRTRITRTAQGDHSLSDAVTPQQLESTSGSETVHMQSLDFSPELVHIIKQAALRLAVPDEILLLTAIGVSIAKLHNKATQTITMVIPGRDGPMDSDLVGLFAEYRRLEVRTSGLSYIGAALSLHYLVKERLWRQPPSVGQMTAPFVNFEWTDFEERQGLSQIPEARHKDTNVHTPMNIIAVSPSRNTWRLLTSFRGDKYTAADLLRIKYLLEESLRCLIEEPLAPVTPP